MAARKLPASIALALFNLCLIAPQALAVWPHDPATGGVVVSAAAFDQDSPHAIPDGTGGAFIVWQDGRNGVDLDIYAQHMSAAGVPLWAANGVPVCTVGQNQQYPHAVSDGAGGVIVVWEDYRSGSSYDMYAQRLNAAGATQWTATGVALCVQPGDQYPSDFPIVPDGAGGAIVAWTDGRTGSLDIYAQRVNAAGAAQWAANGVAICTAAGYQQVAEVASDGAGGAIIGWTDSRPGNGNVYAQRVNGSGVVQWTANGVQLCVAAGGQGQVILTSDGAGGAWLAWADGRNGNNDIYAEDVNGLGYGASGGSNFRVCTDVGFQFNPQVTSDGSGGAIVTWSDYRAGNYDIYAQHLNSGGAPLWSLNGIALCSNVADQNFPILIGDGTGGAIVTWQDNRGGGSNIEAYAQRVTPTGTALWAYDGAAVSVGPSAQFPLSLVSDGAGGAIVVIQDIRSLTNDDLYAQRIEKYGWLGNPEPSIAAVRDVPFDQGGHVKLSWNAGYIDADPYDAIDNYRVWRSIPPNLATSIQRGMLRAERDPEAAARPGAVLVTGAGAAQYFWEVVGTQAAAQLPGYSLEAATAGDSVGAGNPRTAFMVEARPPYGTAHWFSAPDSGYSVDNLPPVIPAPFSGNFAAGITHLHWNPNLEPDLANYRVYRGSSAGFVPGPSNLIGSPPDTGFADAGAGSWYKLSAVDTHGNESGFALLSPSQTSNVDGAPPVAFAFSSPWPNPARESAQVRLALPAAARVRLALYDMSGRLVRVLRSGTLGAGSYDLPIDLLDVAGRPVRSGIYVVRLEAAGRDEARRLIVVR